MIRARPSARLWSMDSYLWIVGLFDASKFVDSSWTCGPFLNSFLEDFQSFVSLKIILANVVHFTMIDNIAVTPYFGQLLSQSQVKS